MSKSSKIHIGTSGWSYVHWKENFYPQKLKSTDWLHYYSQNFSTVEVNTTFYHTPKKETVQKWVSEVPKHFKFSVKASQYLTHRKRLHDCEESLQFFYQSIENFEDKIGPILFQLPPSFKINKERLEGFIHLLSNQYSYTFEFRHPTWFIDEIYNLLTKNQIALCITDLNGQLTPEEITSNFTYIRLHGPKKAYQGSYGTAQLKKWKDKIKNYKVSVYCYFDNDEKGYAIQDAKLLQEFCN